jgi:uncharacterized zinc-type alcohol dehydrogenase-like protein
MKFMITAYAAKQAKGKLEPFQYDPGALGDDQVEIKVEYCGICHSDLSMIDNEWGQSEYPLVAGHEVIGTIGATGAHVKHLKVGQRVGLGWYSHSDLSCEQCMAGDLNLCPNAESTISTRGGFADKVRAHHEWVLPLPQNLDPKTSGPLFCGGITVFNPIVQNGIKPTDHVGVIGIGGLGHLALQFLNAWGCEVTAFTTSDNKKAEAQKLGAHNVVNTHAKDALANLGKRFDMMLVTANADLDWSAYLNTLRPRGHLHFVGVAPSPVCTHVFPLLSGQLCISGSPLGSPATTTKMLDFAARHKIAPITEHFPMSKINDAFDHLRAGKARYRIVLQAGQ